jgi:hypothetical protein
MLETGSDLEGSNVQIQQTDTPMSFARLAQALYALRFAIKAYQEPHCIRHLKLVD